MTQMDFKDITAANMKNTVVTLTKMLISLMMQIMIGLGDLEPLVRGPAVVMRPHTAPQSHVKVRIIIQLIQDHISIFRLECMKWTQ